MSRIWPRSLMGQMLLAVAIALMLVQGFGTVLLYRAQAERRDAALLHAVAMRLLTSTREFPSDRFRRDDQRRHPRPELFGGPRSFRLEHSSVSPVAANEMRDAPAEIELKAILADQSIAISDAVIVRRAVKDDPSTLKRLKRRAELLGQPPTAVVKNVMIGAIRKRGSDEWLVVRTPIPAYERALLGSLLAQTLLIYAVLVGAIALILRRITRPLAKLTGQVERFASTRSPDGQLRPEGPDDVRRLIVAHNAMEARIAALLDEKDVMLGAIGHDLKTPLAALRVRIESVDNETERGKMARTIDDIARTLDDILSLARSGRPRGPTEAVELSALVASVAEEYEDIGEPVTLADSARLVLQLRSTWLRRALRNLIGNALRYGKAARISLVSEGNFAVINVEDDGPGIPEAQMDSMLEPFTRGEPSRNSETGGAGLGLALARAIAEQHGGSLTLINLRGPDGAVIGLKAALRLPII